MNSELFMKRVNELSQVRFLSRTEKYYTTDYNGATIIVNIKNDNEDNLPILIKYNDVFFAEVDHLEIGDDEGAIYDTDGNLLVKIDTTYKVFTLDYNRDLSEEDDGTKVAIVYDLTGTDISYIEGCKELESAEEEYLHFPLVDDISIKPVDGTYEASLKYRMSTADLRPITVYREKSDDIPYLQSKIYSTIHDVEENIYNTQTIGHLGFVIKLLDNVINIYRTIKEPEYIACINVLDSNDVMTLRYMDLIAPVNNDERTYMSDDKTIICISLDPSNTDEETPIAQFYEDYILSEENKDEVCDILSKICRILMKYPTDFINTTFDHIDQEDINTLKQCDEDLMKFENEEFEKIFFKHQGFLFDLDTILEQVDNYELELIEESVENDTEEVEETTEK